VLIKLGASGVFAIVDVVLLLRFAPSAIHPAGRRRAQWWN
jgi:hypothetical protein